MSYVLKEAEKLDLSDTNMVDDLMVNCNALRERAQKAEAEARRLAGEVKRYEEMWDMQQALIADLRKGTDNEAVSNLLEQIEKCKADRDRWMKIAEEKQAQIMMAVAMQPSKNLDSWEDLPEADVPDKFGAYTYICPGKRHWREEAARELETEASEWIMLTPERRAAFHHVIITINSSSPDCTLLNCVDILHSMLAGAEGK